MSKIGNRATIAEDTLGNQPRAEEGAVVTSLAVVDQDWRDGALCRDTSPELFFPVGVTGPAIGQIAAAKQICSNCDSATPCLEFAIVFRQDTGVWGGTSEEERRMIRRSRNGEERGLKLA